jgi:hypothetical protein
MCKCQWFGVIMWICCGVTNQLRGSDGISGTRNLDIRPFTTTDHVFECYS